MKAVLSIGTIYLVCSSDTLAQTAHARFSVSCRSYEVTSRVFGLGEGKRGNEFAEWHVAWLAE